MGNQEKQQLGGGIKSMRKNKGYNQPTHDCPNCKCKRYSSCGCMKSNGMSRLERRQLRMSEYEEAQKSKVA